MVKRTKVWSKKVKQIFFESRFRPTAKQKKIALIVIGAIFVMMVIGQFIYPRDRALPFTKVAGVDVGGKSTEEIRQLAVEMEDRTELEVYGHDRTLLKEKVGSLGVDIDEAQVAAQAVNYSWWLRLIPTSFLWAGPRVDQAAGSVDIAKADSYVADHLDILDATPVNARLRVDGGSVVIDSSKQGAHMTAEALKAGLVRGSYALAGVTRLDVGFESKDPSIDNDDLGSLKAKAQAAVDVEIELRYGDKAVAVPIEERGSWLVLNQDSATKPDDIKMSLDANRVAAYANNNFKEQAIKPAGVTEVYLTDGVEQRRVDGATGKAIDGGRLTATLSEHIFSSHEKTIVELPIADVPPQIKKHHTFTKSQAGLQAYVNSLADEGDIRVTVRQLGGHGWSASYRGGEQTVAASTYKVYVVAYALNQIKEGKASYDENINGTSMRTCIERTIIQSDNACPEVMLKRFGARNIANYFHERGYSQSTGFGVTHAMTTTNDLVKAMTDIQSGSLVSSSEQAFMMDLLGRTNHRAGVPAGSAAPRVLNKVGFLEGYLNDAAIVYHPGGTYVISVMTKGQSWAKIAEITRKIEELMY